MPERDELRQQLIEIAAALSVSEHALLALGGTDEGRQARPEADAVEIAENFLAISNPRSRHLLLRLSRRLVERDPR